MPDQTLDITADSRRIWNTIAPWWDDRIGDGNDFQNYLIEPATERLLDIKPGEKILDIACGAGRFARHMAALGARVTAFDFCDAFLERARRRTPPELPITYHTADATDADAIRAFGLHRFDKATATMCLMDIADIDPLLAALPDVLKPGGCLVFSICHPCFHSADTQRYVEEVSQDGRLTTVAGVKVVKYLTPFTFHGEGIVGQAEPQYYFHRPLSALLGAAFAHGFALTGLEEPALPAETDHRRLRWTPELPPVLVARLQVRT